MSTILVTGSSGFIGRPAVAALRRIGHAVHGLDPSPVPAAVFPQHADGLDSMARLTTLLAREGVDTIVHGGGVSGPLVARGDPRAITDANVVGSLNLFEAARRTGVRRIVSLSSMAAVGATQCDVVGDDAALRPADVYGASKASVELMLGAYAAEFDIRGVSLRLPTVYGPGDRGGGFIARMIADALAGRAVALAWGRGYACPYLFVEDAVAAICLAVAADGLRLPAYNIAGAEHVDTQTIAGLVAEHVPGARITLGDGPPMPGYRRAAMDIRAAERDMGFLPQVGIASGIARTVAWARSEPAAAG